MPPKNITSESTPYHVDFGSNLPTSLMFDDDMVYDRVPGSWLGDPDSDYEEFSDPNLTKSEARALFKEAMADLQRATSEADEQKLRRQGRRALREELTAEEGQMKDSKTLTWNSMASLQREIDEEEGRLRRQVLREEHAAEGSKLASDAVKGDKKPASSSKSSTVASAQNNVAGLSTRKVRRPILRPSVNSGPSPSAASTAVSAQSNARGVASNNPRLPRIDPSSNSIRSSNSSSTAFTAQTDASGVASNNVRRSIVDPSLNSG